MIFSKQIFAILLLLGVLVSLKCGKPSDGNSSGDSGSSVTTEEFTLIGEMVD